MKKLFQLEEESPQRALEVPMLGRFNAASGKPPTKINIQTVLFWQGKELDHLTSATPSRSICVMSTLSLLYLQQATFY